MIGKPTDKEVNAILVRCIPCYLNDTETRYPRGRDCPRCGGSNDRAYEDGSGRVKGQNR